MQTEPLYEGEFRYSEPPVVVPDPNGGGRLFGVGDGQLTGRLSGSARWANAPRFDTDDVFHPVVQGVITTDDGATIFYETRGASSAPRHGQRVLGSFVQFETGDERYAWLDGELAYEEGALDVDSGRIRVRAFLCSAEPPDKGSAE